MSVIAVAVISLDGFVARANDDPGPIFDWYQSGDVEIAPGDPERAFHLTRASADHLVDKWGKVGAAVIGRHLFDITNGWEGRPPAGGGHVVVITHEPPTDWEFAGTAPFEFVSGVEAGIARARELAGDGDVTVTGGEIAGQALAAGLVDVLRLDVTPVLLGAGVSFWGDFSGPETLFEDPEIVAGNRVLHLEYRRRG